MEVFIVGLLAATLRVATPLIYATLGEVFCERAGILNLGIEGIMLLGAFVGFATTSQTGSLGLGVLAACIAGILAGLLMAFLTVWLGVNQHVSGLGITLLGTGLSYYAYRVIFGEPMNPPQIKPYAQVDPLRGVEMLGPILRQYPMTYVAILVIPIVWFILYRTSFGLNIRSVGENPEAADAAGVNVYGIRTLALMIGGGFMGVGGSFLTLSTLGFFTFDIIAGRGWVCIALVIFGNWNPIRVLWGALLFGGVSALQMRLQITGLRLPYEAFLALPYIVTIIALTIANRNAAYPAALLKPYKRE
ncbi:MAG: ABC transporter permease [Anaerolineaceae bacterium]|nr:ABC transporter permease [Anaerolineaceae bacterium]